MTIQERIDQLRDLTDIELACLEVGARAEAQRRTLERWNERHPSVWQRIIRSVRRPWLHSHHHGQGEPSTGLSKPTVRPAVHATGVPTEPVASS